MERIFKNIKSMLADSFDSESLSSKRVISMLAFIFCSIGYFVDLFTDYTVSAHMFDSMMWIVVGGLGFTGLEKFAGSRNQNG